MEKVRPASLAEEVGLEVGDQIVEVNETSFLNIGHKEVSEKYVDIICVCVCVKQD